MKLIITAKQSFLFKTTEAMGLQYTELMKAGDRPTFFVVVVVVLSILKEAEIKTRLGNYV